MFNFQKNVRVAVLGASGGIGQPMSLLLKLNEQISELALYDIVHTLGVAADLSHISTPAKVRIRYLCLHTRIARSFEIKDNVINLCMNFSEGKWPSTCEDFHTFFLACILLI